MNPVKETARAGPTVTNRVIVHRVKIMPVQKMMMVSFKNCRLNGMQNWSQIINRIVKKCPCVGKSSWGFIWFGARDTVFSLKGRISRLPKQPCWLYALIALQQHSALLRKLYPSENWLSLRCLTSGFRQKLACPFWYRRLTITIMNKDRFQLKRTRYYQSLQLKSVSVKPCERDCKSRADCDQRSDCPLCQNNVCTKLDIGK